MPGGARPQASSSSRTSTAAWLRPGSLADVSSVTGPSRTDSRSPSRS